MAWMSNAAPQIYNTFASLGIRHGDTYRVNEDCLAILEEILRKLAMEDQTLRTFRRAIGFGQNIRKDLIPLLIYVKDDTKITDATKIIDTTIKILVNLTVPVECLLSIEAASRTDVGKHTIFELNRLLATSKEAFTDSRSTKAVMDHMKHVVIEKDLNIDIKCDSINNCLLLLRNILHIPDQTMQNEIIWNLFTQSIDKIIIYLLSHTPMYWGVTMVQLIALMYKDQHVGTLQKLLNLWLEASLSESSEDNESNTSPPDQNSGDSSPIITSDPTSDSSDNGGSNKITNNLHKTSISSTTEVVRAAQNRSKALAGMKRVKSTETDSGISIDSSTTSTTNSTSTNSNSNSNSNTNSKTSTQLLLLHHQHQQQQQHSSSSATATSASTPSAPFSSSAPFVVEKKEGKMNDVEISSVAVSGAAVVSLSSSGVVVSSSGGGGVLCGAEEVSDCGYVTQVENQESISTSSNDDERPLKPVHQKPHHHHHAFQKTRYSCSKNRLNNTTALEKKELRRKKLVKRSKTNIINMKGLMHHTPTDEDISNILKEFTVDFLLKGYGNLVCNLHSQLLTDIQVPIDTSHFFWLVTYFLKFATQLELDLEHIAPVLSYEIISYLIFQGVWLYEELEISCKVPEFDLKPCLRRLHLVVTAIREFLQAVETYQKSIHLSDEDRTSLSKLQKQIAQIEDLKCLFLLLLRQYNPALQSKQYLQDLIVTNHIYLLFLENTSKTEDNINIVEHLKEFATVEIMRQYGLLLENFKENGEFVNNCVFTMMHHIGGDLEHVSTLFQPSILKTFSQIWETDYEICDDWSDLIEYVIHKFINTPRKSVTEEVSAQINHNNNNYKNKNNKEIMQEIQEVFRLEVVNNDNKNSWTKEEKDTLLEYYNMSKDSKDTIGIITKKYQQGRSSLGRYKTQESIIKELFEQNIIDRKQYEDFFKQYNKHEIKQENEFEDIYYRRHQHHHNLIMSTEELREEKGGSNKNLLFGDIKVLKECLFKEHKTRLIIWLQNIVIEACFVKLALANMELLQKSNNVMEPIVYYHTLLNLPIPVVAWTNDHITVLKHQPFVLLLHKLGFYLPADTGKVFVRIPNFWTADYLFSIAQQLGPIDTNKLKFDVSLLDGKKSSPFKSILADVAVMHCGNGNGKFALNEFKKHTPSIIRYTPMPNSTEWIQNILKSKITTTPVIHKTLHIPSCNELSITIPEIEPMACDLPPPQLSIVETMMRKSDTNAHNFNSEKKKSKNEQVTKMDISSSEETVENENEKNPQKSLLNVNIEDEEEEEEEHNSICETSSVASDLTRMCVSDEEEKIIN